MYHLIYMDDDPEDLEMAQIAFEQMGWAHRVGLLHSGKELLHYLDTLTHPLDFPYLLLLDYHIGGMTAEDLLVLLRSNPRYAGLPVVILTTGFPQSGKDRLFQLGAKCCVDKPTSLGAFTGLATRLKLISGEIAIGQPPSFDLLSL